MTYSIPAGEATLRGFGLPPSRAVLRCAMLLWWGVQPPSLATSSTTSVKPRGSQLSLLPLGKAGGGQRWPWAVVQVGSRAYSKPRAGQPSISSGCDDGTHPTPRPETRPVLQWPSQVALPLPPLRHLRKQRGGCGTRRRSQWRGASGGETPPRAGAERVQPSPGPASPYKHRCTQV